MTKIITNYTYRFINVEIKEYLIPTWVHKLVIEEAKDIYNEECYAEAYGDYGGKCATITLYPIFFNLGIEDQQRIMDHELIHLLIWPLSGFAEVTLDEDAEALHVLLNEATEAVTEDIRRAFNST